MEYSIQEVARAAGTTSRTLRHYDDIGLVKPSRVGNNGYRFYDDRSLVRLQRVLMLRGLGLGLDAIADVLKAQGAPGDSAAEAHLLEQHLALLHDERNRVDRQIAAVKRTISALTDTCTERNGLMEANMFDGFDHTQYREEVVERWGADAYKASDAWWRGLGEAGQQEWKTRLAELNTDWIAAAERGEDPASPSAQELAQRHVDWLRAMPGTPAHGSGERVAAYLLGLGEMYVADERFAANYGGAEGAAFVRDALKVYTEQNL